MLRCEGFLLNVHNFTFISLFKTRISVCILMPVEAALKLVKTPFIRVFSFTKNCSLSIFTVFLDVYEDKLDSLVYNNIIINDDYLTTLQFIHLTLFLYIL